EGDNIVSRGRHGAGVVGGSTPPVLLLDQSNIVGKRSQCPSKVVSRAIVDHDHLVCRVILCQRALHRVTDRRRGLVGGDHDREGGRPAERLHRFGRRRRKDRILALTIGRVHSGNRHLWGRTTSPSLPLSGVGRPSRTPGSTSKNAAAC